MLLYITNRKLPKTPGTAPLNINVKDIKHSLASPYEGHQDAIIFGISSANYRQVKFYPKGNEADLFNSIKDDELKKPWLFLLHGFHQDPAETIKKTRALIDIHDVNVILFSWPSRPKPINAFNTDSINTLVQSSVRSLLAGMGTPSIAPFLIKETKKAIADFKNNYLPARQNARLSSTDFYNALDIVNSLLLPKIKQAKLSLLVHSMGNYLLQHCLISKKSLPISFYNIICHQADVKSSNHVSWMPGLYPHARHKLYITVNVYDYVLAASNILNKMNGEKNTERLGQSVNLKPNGLQQGYIQGAANYLDFTDAKGINSRHEIFTENSDSIDPLIVELLSRLFRSDVNDKLPNKKSAVKGGFRMMPTLPSVYKPQWIIEDESLCDGGYDDDCLISSLKYFEDPFKNEADYVEELEEDEY